MTHTATGAPRVALVSVGMGRVQRGFERYFGDLFGVVQGEAAVTLFKSAGPLSVSQRVPVGLRWVTRLVHALPGRWWGRTPYHRDCLAFALCLLPALRSGRFDVIHCIDPPLAAVLARLRQRGLLKTPLLFTEGSVMPPSFYPAADHIHHVGQAARDQALAHGVPAALMSLIPCGVHSHRFVSVDTAARDALRQAHGVAAGCLVVLVVSALKRDHKRVDHLIEEVAGLLSDKTHGELLLWLDGHPEEAEVEALAHSRLGECCRISHVAPQQVQQLYQMADVLVHGALEESFGLGIVEALCCGLPVLVHNSAHFRWLVGADGQTVDMAQPGALAQALRHWLALHPSARPRPDVGRVRSRFDWAMLRPAYAELYRRVVRSVPGR